MGGAPVLETVRPGVTLEPGAAASFRRLEARLGRRADVNRTYADYATQLRMYNAWNAYKAGRAPHPGHSRALHPDQSVHCQGRAWDTDDWRTPGFIALAAEYGWIRTAANDPTEQHHFEYQWARDQHRNEPTPAATPSSKPILQEDEMIRIQAPNRGIALIGPGYYRPLGNDEEVNNSGPLISAHHTGNDRQFDLWVSMAIQGNIAGGVADLVRTESRPVKLYKTSKGLEAFGQGGKTWIVPSDAYRVLLDALGVAGPQIIRTIPDNERTFLLTILGTLNPDPAAAAQVDAVMKLTDEDAKRIADAIQAELAEGVADELADRLKE